MQDRGVWAACGQDVADAVQRRVVDFDELGCVVGESAVFGDDDGDRLADVADAVAGEDRTQARP